MRWWCLVGKRKGISRVFECKMNGCSFARKEIMIVEKKYSNIRVEAQTVSTLWKSDPHISPHYYPSLIHRDLAFIKPRFGRYVLPFDRSKTLPPLLNAGPCAWHGETRRTNLFALQRYMIIRPCSFCYCTASEPLGTECFLKRTEDKERKGNSRAVIWAARVGTAQNGLVYLIEHIDQNDGFPVSRSSAMTAMELAWSTWIFASHRVLALPWVNAFFCFVRVTLVAFYNLQVRDLDLIPLWKCSTFNQ